MFKVGDEIKFNPNYVDIFKRRGWHDLIHIFGDTHENIKGYILCVISIKPRAGTLYLDKYEICLKNKKAILDLNYVIQIPDDNLFLFDTGEEQMFLKIDNKVGCKSVYCCCNERRARLITISQNLSYFYCDGCRKEIK
jgi:hypothetical protein